MLKTKPVGLLLSDGVREPSLLRLAQLFGVPIISELCSLGDLHLSLCGSQLTLCMGVGKQSICHALDFDLSSRVKAKGSDPLLRAMGGEHRTVVDLTAGWGRDAQFLANNGYTVHAFEQQPVLAMMLTYAQQRIADDELARRLFFYHHDSRQNLREFILNKARIDKPDVVYIDPMFPPKTRQSAAVKKEVVLLQHLAGDFSEKSDASLLNSALELDVKRVVVKRPLKANPLPGREPSGSIKGKLIRFDIYG